MRPIATILATAQGREESAVPAASSRPFPRQRALTAAVLASVLCLGLVSAAQAAPGDLDASFSGDGMQVVDFGGDDSGEGVVVQADGKIVVAGGQNGDFTVARFNADGSLDATFSGDGHERADFGGAFEAALDVALQADGKIVAVGRVDSNFALARFNADGSLDTTFSGDGKQTTIFSGDGATGVAIQADGKIVAAGRAGSDFALARYNADGSPDTTFSSDGKETTDFGASTDAAMDVAVDANGKIVAAGSAGPDFALARYNPDGSLDTTFSGDGKQTTDFSAEQDAAHGVAVQADGKIVAAGVGGLDFAVTRYGVDGALDTSFSDDGKQTAGFASLWGNAASAVTIDSDGRIVVVGQCCIGDLGGSIGVARFNADGSTDTTFSGDGRREILFGTGNDSAADVGLQPDGKVVVVGATAGAVDGDTALARLHGAQTDATPPSVSIASPVGGATVPASVIVEASASDNVGVVSVEFYVNGVRVGTDTGALDCPPSYCVEWNATGVTGQHTLTALARDAAGNAAASAPVTVTVEGIAPSVAITAPAAGATVSGLTTVSASASDNVGVIEVAFWLDVDPICPWCGFGAETFLGSDRTFPYEISWDTNLFPNGQHRLTALAFDAAGNSTASAEVGVTINNGDTAAPAVSITAPAAGATVSGSVTVSADASDNVGFAGVQFRLDGANLGVEDVSAPYSVSWDTTTVADGSHTLTAVARDAAGNTATSVAVTVTVSNAPPPPPPPPCADTVQVTRAEYSSGARQLRVEGTSTIAGAVLTVWNATGTQIIGRLTPDGGGRYRGQFNNLANPVTIRVTTDRNPCETDEVRVAAK